VRPVFVVLAIGIANTVGCGSTDPDPDDFNLAPGALPPIVTDAERYTLTKVPGGYDAVAQAVYTNTTGRMVYYQRCTSELSGALYGVRRTGADSAAQSWVGGAWACVGGVPTGRLRPGESLRAAVWLGSTDSPNARPPIRPEERVGRFRIEFQLCTSFENDSDNCTLLLQTARQSNAFELRFPEAGGQGS
jgi:hypothetical protein